MQPGQVGYAENSRERRKGLLLHLFGPLSTGEARRIDFMVTHGDRACGYTGRWRAGEISAFFVRNGRIILEHQIRQPANVRPVRVYAVNRQA